MKLTHVFNVRGVIIEERNATNNRYSIYADGHRPIQFVFMIPLIGNLFALLWWLSSFGKHYEYPDNPADKKIIYNSVNRRKS